MDRLIPNMVLSEIIAANVPYEIINGSRHWKLFVCNRLAGILPKSKHSETDRRAVLNMRSQVRRVIQEFAH